jgi:putative aldouronate transport system substrate-binding protein
MKKHGLLVLLLLVLISAVALATGTAEAEGPAPLTVEVFDRGQGDATDNVITQWIQEHLLADENIAVTYFPIPRGQEVDGLNVHMAAGDAPDIVFTYNVQTWQGYARQGGLVDYGPILEDYGQDILDFFGEAHMALGQLEHVQWTVPGMRPIAANFSGVIRQDWLDALGLDVPETIDEFYDTMVAFKEEDPGNLGDDVIPFAMGNYLPNPTWGIRMIMEAFREPMSQRDRAIHFEPAWTWPGTKEALRFVNQMYNEGLISPDFALDTTDDSQLNRDISAGRVGSLIGNYNLVYRLDYALSTTMADNVPGARFWPFDAFANSEGDHPKTIQNTNSFFIFTPTFSDAAEEAIRYLNWMIDPDNLFIIHNGFQGVHYTELVDGIPQNFVPTDQLETDEIFNKYDIGIISQPPQFGDPVINARAESLAYPGFEREIQEAIRIAMDDGVLPYNFESALPVQSRLGASLIPYDDQIYVNAITCDPEDFDEVYDSLVEEWLDAGGQDVLDERRTIYDQENP